MAEVASKYTRIDGKELTQKQKRELLNSIKAKEQAEYQDFDPRKKRLVHGIRNYVEPGQQTRAKGTFEGSGTAIGMSK